MHRYLGNRLILCVVDHRASRPRTLEDFDSWLFSAFSIPWLRWSIFSDVPAPPSMLQGSICSFALLLDSGSASLSKHLSVNSISIPKRASTASSTDVGASAKTFSEHFHQGPLFSHWPSYSASQHLEVPPHLAAWACRFYRFLQPGKVLPHRVPKHVWLDRSWLAVHLDEQLSRASSNRDVPELPAVYCESGPRACLSSGIARRHCRVLFM